MTRGCTFDPWWVDTLDPNEKPFNTVLLTQPIEVLRTCTFDPSWETWTAILTQDLPPRPKPTCEACKDSGWIVGGEDRPKGFWFTTAQCECLAGESVRLTMTHCETHHKNIGTYPQ